MKDVYNALYLWHYHIQMRHEYPIHLYSEHPNVWLQPDNNVLRNYWNRLYYRTPIPHHHDRHERWDRPDQGLFAVSTPSTTLLSKGADAH